jgi:hypothetical protein
MIIVLLKECGILNLIFNENSISNQSLMVPKAVTLYITNAYGYGMSRVKIKIIKILSICQLVQWKPKYRE